MNRLPVVFAGLLLLAGWASECTAQSASDRIARLEADVEFYKADIDTLERMLSLSEQDSEIKAATIDSLTVQVGKLKEQVDLLKQVLYRESTAISEYQTMLDELEAESDALGETITALIEQVEILQQALRDARNQWTWWEQTLTVSALIVGLIIGVVLPGS